jgi:hypothetical protein
VSWTTSPERVSQVTAGVRSHRPRGPKLTLLHEQLRNEERLRQRTVGWAAPSKSSSALVETSPETAA